MYVKDYRSPDFRGILSTVGVGLGDFGSFPTWLYKVVPQFVS